MQPRASHLAKTIPIESTNPADTVNSCGTRSPSSFLKIAHAVVAMGVSKQQTRLLLDLGAATVTPISTRLAYDMKAKCIKQDVRIEGFVDSEVSRSRVRLSRTCPQCTWICVKLLLKLMLSVILSLPHQYAQEKAISDMADQILGKDGSLYSLTDYQPNQVESTSAASSTDVSLNDTLFILPSPVCSIGSSSML